MNFDLKTTLYSLPGILLGLTIHEFCHAFCAWKLGDNTAREQGRLTLNPLKHIDPIGFLFIIIAGFGWAKPVQFAPENLRNFRRDKAMIAAAGPLSNLVLGVIFTLGLKMFINHITKFSATEFNAALGTTFFYILLYSAFINFGLFIFNLIPIPPLDGSHIVFSGLNLEPEIEENIRKIGMPVLIIILLAQNYSNITIIPISKWINAIVNFILELKIPI
jgi:Zn-dependent protease